MKSIKLLIITLVILIGAGCASVTKDIKVETEADPRMIFSNYHSYEWLATAEILHDPAGQWEPPGFDTDDELRLLIDKQLQKRGLKKNPATPDLIVGFVMGVDMAALGVKLNPDTQELSLENIPKGGLVIVLVDALTGYVVWTGVATANIKEKPDSDVVRKRLSYAVKEMFKSIPYEYKSSGGY